MTQFYPKRWIPYFALTQAFNRFCDYLLTESAEQLEQWREKILNAVSVNGQILIDVIPHLELIIGKQPVVAKVGSHESQNRFNLVFQNFMKTICQQNHPLVLFIDDLQWADLASLNLLKILITDPESQYFLIIGAYRDNEVSATHSLMMTIDDLKKANVVINTIQLANLSRHDVNTLIVDTLEYKIALHPLTQLVYEKTQGNAFFTHQFLKSLYEQELLSFDWQTQKWQWDIEQIAAKEMTDNVVELMTDKIKKLPTDVQKVVKLAACIGNQFDLNSLSIIFQKTPKETLQFLWQAIEEELLLPLDDNYKLLGSQEEKTVATHFKFQHDRIQQAAYSLISENERPLYICK